MKHETRNIKQELVVFHNSCFTIHGFEGAV